MSTTLLRLCSAIFGVVRANRSSRRRPRPCKLVVYAKRIQNDAVLPILQFLASLVIPRFFLIFASVEPVQVQVGVHEMRQDAAHVLLLVSEVVSPVPVVPASEKNSIPKWNLCLDRLFFRGPLSPGAGGWGQDVCVHVHGPFRVSWLRIDSGGDSILVVCSVSVRPQHGIVSVTRVTFVVAQEGVGWLHYVTNNLLDDGRHNRVQEHTDAIVVGRCSAQVRVVVVIDLLRYSLREMGVQHVHLPRVKEVSHDDKPVLGEEVTSSLVPFWVRPSLDGEAKSTPWMPVCWRGPGFHPLVKALLTPQHAKDHKLLQALLVHGLRVEVSIVLFAWLFDPHIICCV
mmetsp:Transcript_30853/g.60223  ORF Transcript_30853/g.60223 Transcript_30853/m.60223 type:complete len:341 (-) Transcript_30853:796-1818(-)